MKKKTTLIKKADKIFSEYIRLSRGKCERCGKKTNLQTAHIVSRDVKKLRYDEDNVFCFCGGCHLFWAHKKPLEFVEFIKATKGEAIYKYLLKTSQVLRPLGIDYYEKILAKYQDKLEKI